MKILDAIGHRVPNYICDPAWCRDPWALRPKGMAGRIADCLAAMPSILQRYDQLSSLRRKEVLDSTDFTRHLRGHSASGRRSFVLACSLTVVQGWRPRPRLVSCDLPLSRSQDCIDVDAVLGLKGSAVGYAEQPVRRHSATGAQPQRRSHPSSLDRRQYSVRREKSCQP